VGLVSFHFPQVTHGNSAMKSSTKNENGPRTKLKRLTIWNGGSVHLIRDNITRHFIRKTCLKLSLYY
jgi:hypothetical protein